MTTYVVHYLCGDVIQCREVAADNIVYLENLIRFHIKNKKQPVFCVSAQNLITIDNCSIGKEPTKKILNNNVIQLYNLKKKKQ